MSETAFDLFSVAVHEAGHALAFLHHGVPVSQLWASEEGGSCLPARFADNPEIRLLSTTCGLVAARMAGCDDAGHASFEDARQGNEALEELGIYEDAHARNRRIRGATQFCARVWPAILTLAEHLAAAGIMNELDIGRLCHRRGDNPLAIYAGLYPEALAPALKSSKKKMRRGDRVRVFTKAF
jgi:hypothetical protein